jgi:hypothetical protein
MAFLVFHTGVDWAVRRDIRHIAVEEADRSRKVAGEGEAVGSHIHPVVEVGRSSEVAVVVDLHILRGIQIQDSLTFLLADVIARGKKDSAGDGLVLATRQKALPNGTVEARCEAWNCLIQLWS